MFQVKSSFKYLTGNCWIICHLAFESWMQSRTTQTTKFFGISLINAVNSNNGGSFAFAREGVTRNWQSFVRARYYFEVSTFLRGSARWRRCTHHEVLFAQIPEISSSSAPPRKQTQLAAQMSIAEPRPAVLCSPVCLLLGTEFIRRVYLINDDSFLLSLLPRVSLAHNTLFHQKQP